MYHSPPRDFRGASALYRNTLTTYLDAESFSTAAPPPRKPRAHQSPILSVQTARQLIQRARVGQVRHEIHVLVSEPWMAERLRENAKERAEICERRDAEAAWDAMVRIFLVSGKGLAVKAVVRVAPASSP